MMSDFPQLENGGKASQCAVLRLFATLFSSQQEHWSGLPCPPPGDLPNPGTKLRSPTLQVDFFFLPAEPQGKPKNTGVGSLSFLQWIFLTQESNRGFLHCGRILYQLSYLGKPLQQGHIISVGLPPKGQASI